MTLDVISSSPSRVADKFKDPDWTAKGEERARVPFDGLKTLWINTGTLCNITCRNCYIESSPTNDRLAYLALDEAAPFLDEAKRLGAREIGFTGGEPFMNPDCLAMARAALDLGFAVLILTNAMQPMRRPRIEDGVVALARAFGSRLTIRVSLDHHTAALHETERGEGTWEKTVAGLDWLAANGVRAAIAGRSCWGETEEKARLGYARLIDEQGWPIDAGDRSALTILPEMTGNRDVPEITTRCWDILHKSPSALMCASTRMVVKRKGAAAPVVLPCTLLPYDQAFEMGASLAEAASANGPMFSDGAVKLCHPHCATFCVLGGGSCS